MKKAPLLEVPGREVAWRGGERGGMRTCPSGISFVVKDSDAERRRRA